MTPLLLYLLKANVLLLLFAAAYFGLLRRLTFFGLNRAYLVGALLLAAVYPAVPVPALLPPVAGPPVALVVVEASGAPSAGAVSGPEAAPLNWAALVLAVYAAGTAVGLARLLGQLLSLRRLRRTAQPAVLHGQAVRVLAGAVSPFSFGQSIYLNPARHAAPELAAVLRHEQVHVRQWHTLDVLLAQLALAAAWCNPAAWLLRRALLDNLEYLADRAALQSGLDQQDYQRSLVRLSQAAAGPSLVSHFTFPTLKNRVAMMHTPLSPTGQLARYFVAGPLVLAVALSFSGARAQETEPVAPTPAAGTPATPTARPAGPHGNETAYYLDGHRTDMKAVSAEVSQNIATLKLLKGEQVRQVFGGAEPAARVTVIVTNRYRDRADVVALDRKVDAAGALDTHFEVGPAVDPAKHQLPDGIKSYLARTYPAAKLTGWFITDKALDKPPHIRYYASLSDGASKRKLYFNAQEQPVSLPASRAEATSSVTSAAEAQSAAPPIVYLDGQPYTGDLKAINPKDIATMSVLKEEKATQFAGAAGANGIIVITTKANQNRADVVAFNARVNSGAPVAASMQPASVPYLAAPALAYITKHYPDARLLEVAEVPAPNGGPARYRAQIAVGRRPMYLLFDAQGQFISELPVSR